MAEIIFARPVHKYDSYIDFWRLVELSGFPVISVSDIDITKDQVIITAPMNGDYKEHLVGNLAYYNETGEITGGQFARQKVSGLPKLAHLIVWNLERPSGSGSVGQYAKESMQWMTYHRFCDEVWVSDSAMADQTMLRYVPLGSDYGLGQIGDNKTYDYTHQSLTIPRRINIYKHLNNAGPNAWPWDNPSRDEILKKSKFALNVHQDNYGFCEPLRIALFAAYGLPIISESFVNSGHYEVYSSFVKQAAYHDLVHSLKSALGEDYTPWREMGEALRNRLCEEYQFGKIVRIAVGESAGTGWR